MWGWDFWARWKLTWISWHKMTMMLVIWYWFHRNLDHLHLLILTTATRSPSRVESIRFLQVGHFYNTQISWLKFADAGTKSSNQRPDGELMNWWIPPNLDQPCLQVRWGSSIMWASISNNPLKSAKGCAWKSIQRAAEGRDGSSKQREPDKSEGQISQYINKLREHFPFWFFSYLPIRL